MELLESYDTNIDSVVLHVVAKSGNRRLSTIINLVFTEFDYNLSVNNMTTIGDLFIDFFAQFNGDKISLYADSAEDVKFFIKEISIL